MRNGDYTPTRLEAQHDAVTLLFNAKTQANPENTVALLSLAGKSPSVLVSLTSDFGKILSALHHIRPSGAANVATGVQIAQLVLKHRENKNQRQRIIVFVGSPVAESDESLVALGKKLKKNNVAVDIVNFGEEAENTAKLEAFIEAVNSGDNSHLVTIPPGPHLLSDMLIASPIISGEDGPPPGIGSTSGYEFGVDPNLDPELAMALRISMEEERARQGGNAGEPAETAATNAKAAAVPSNIEDDMLQQALAMSMQGDGQAMADVEMSEDEEIARAMALSMQGGGNMDADVMGSIVGSLPGVDVNDPRIQAALGGKKEEGESEGKNEKK